MSGFFSVERAIFESEQFRSPQDRYAAIWLIGNVAWEDRWQKVGKTVKRVERGHGFWSLRFLSEAWGTSLKTVRGTLEHFEKIAFLTITAGTHGTVITVCNYDYFQTPQKIRAHGGHTEIEKTQKKGTLKGTPDAVISDCEETEIHDEGTRRAHKRARRGHTEGTNYNNITNKQDSEDIRPNKPDLELAVAEWNATAEQSGFPKVQRLTDKRKASLTARLRECGGIDGWRAALEKVAASPYLRGEVNGWRADFDFVINPNKFTSIMEGKYDRRDSVAKPAKRRDPLDVAAEYLGRNQDHGISADRGGRPIRDWPDVDPDRTGGEPGSDQGGTSAVYGPGAGAGHREGFDAAGADYGAPDRMERGEVVSLFRHLG
jgi:hypothetical protein